MKTFENIDVKSVKKAVGLLQKFQQKKKKLALVGGGSEYLQLMKDHVVEPDYSLNLKTIAGLDFIKEERGGFRIGALAKLADIEEHGVTEIYVPDSQSLHQGFLPQVREGLAWDHAIVAVATIVESSGGMVRDARVVLGA